MNTVSCRAFKNTYPDSHLTFNISKRYSAIKDLFLYNKYIDDVKVWDGYNDNWESKDYTDFINSSKFDLIYDPMIGPGPDWQTKRHQTEELCLVRNLKPPQDLRVELNQYFEIYNGYNNYIAICHQGATDSYKKNLPSNKLDELCNLILKHGYKPLFFQNKYKNFDFINESFFESVRFMLSTRLLITIDSAMSWIASGYKFPTIGLYNQNYYLHHGATTSKNWQPINPNSIYLEAPSMQDINIYFL
jgi:hypothetical protein